MANPDAAAREAITIVGVLGLILAFSLITWARKRGNGNKGEGDAGKDKKNREKDDRKKGKGDDGKKGKDEKKKDRNGKDGEGKKGDSNGKGDGQPQPANTPASTDFDPNKKTDGAGGNGGAGNLGQDPGTSRLTGHYTLDPELDLSVTSDQPYKIKYHPGPPPPIYTGRSINQPGPGGRGGPGGWYGGSGGPSSPMGGIMRAPQTASIPSDLQRKGPFAPYGLPTGRPPQGYDIVPGDYARPVIRQPVTPIAIPAYQPYVGRAPSLVSPSSLSYGSSPTSISPLTPDQAFELRTAIMPEEFDPYTYASAQPAKSYFTSKELHQDPLDLAATNDNRERVEAGLNAKPGRRLSELLGIPGLGESLGPASDDRYNSTLFGELNQNPRERQTQAQNMVSPTRVKGPQYSPIDLEPRTLYTREEEERVTNLSPLKPGGTETTTELPGKAGEKAKQREKQNGKERLREGRRWDEVNGVYVSPKAVDLPTPLMGEGEKARKVRKELNAEADDHERAKAKTKKERTKVPISPERGSNREKVKKMKKKRVKVLDPKTNRITHEEVLVTDDESREIDERVSPTKPRRRVQIISADGQSEGEEVYDKHGRIQREKVRRKVRIGSEDEYVTVDEDGRRIKKKNKKRSTLSEEEEDERARTRRRNRAKGEDIYDSGEEELSKNRGRAKARREKVRNGRGGVDIDDEEEEDIYERVRGEDGRTRLRKRIPQRSRRRIDEADEYEEDYEVDRLQQGGQGRARRRAQQPYYQDEVPLQHVPFDQQQQQYLQHQQQQQQPQLVQAEPILAQTRKVDHRVIEDEIARSHPGMSLSEREELARMRIQRIEAEQDKLNNRERKPVQHRSNGDGDEIEDAPIKPIRERKENQVEPPEISDGPGITRPGRRPRTQNDLEERYPTGPDQRTEVPIEGERIEISNDQEEIVKPKDEITLGHSERSENDQRREKIKEIEKQFMSRPMPTGPSNNRRPRRQLSDSKPPERPHEAGVREVKDNTNEPLSKSIDIEVPDERAEVSNSPVEERILDDRGEGVTEGRGGSDHTVKPEHTEHTVKPEPHVRPVDAVKPENTVKPVELDRTVRPDENERSDGGQFKADEEEARETVRRERENAEAPSWGHNARGEQRVERPVSPRGDSHRDTHDVEREEEPAIRARPKPRPETSRAPPAPRDEHLETRHTSPVKDSGLSDYERWSKDDDEGMQGLLYAQRGKDKIRYGQLISEIYDSTKLAKPQDKESFCEAALDNWMLNRARLKARNPNESEESLLRDLVNDRLKTEHYLAEGRERRGQVRPQPRPARNDSEIVSDQRERIQENRFQQREGQEIDAERANIISKDPPMEEDECKQLIREVIDSSHLPKPEDEQLFCDETFKSWKDKRSRLREKYPSKGDRALLRGHVTKCLRKEAENNGRTRLRPEANNHERESQAPERLHEKPERRRKPRAIRENREEERLSPTRDTSNAANGLRTRRGERRENRLDALNGVEDREVVDVSNLNDEEIEEYEKTGKIPTGHESRDGPAKVSRDKREKPSSGHTPDDAESDEDNAASKTELQMATTKSGPVPDEDADIGASDEVSTKHRKIRKKQPMPISDRPEYTAKSKEDALSPTNGKKVQDTWDDPYGDGSDIIGSKARPATRPNKINEISKDSSLDQKASGYHSDEGYESAEVDLTEKKHGPRGNPIHSSINPKISENDNSRETDIFEHTASVKPSTYRGRRDMMGDTADGDSTQLSLNTRETEEESGRGHISQHTDKIKLTRRKACEDPADEIQSFDHKERSLHPKDSNNDNTDLFEHTKDVNPTQGRFDEKSSKTSKIHTIVGEKDSGKPKAWPLDGEDPFDQFQKDLLRENQAPLQVHPAFVLEVDPIAEEESEHQGSTRPLNPPNRKGSKPPRAQDIDNDRSEMKAMGHRRRHEVKNDPTDKKGRNGEANGQYEYPPVSPVTPEPNDQSQARSRERETRIKEGLPPYDISPLEESYAESAARVRRNKQEDSERRKAAGAGDGKVRRKVRVGSVTEDESGRITQANQSEILSPTETKSGTKRRSKLKTSNHYEEKVPIGRDVAPKPRQKRGVSISEDRTYIGEPEIVEKKAQFEHSSRTTRGKENDDVEIDSPKPRQKKRGVSFSEDTSGNEESSRPKGRRPQAENRDINTRSSGNGKPDHADLTEDEVRRDEDDGYRAREEKADDRQAQFKHSSRRKNDRREKESDEIYEGDDDIANRRDRSRRPEVNGRGRQEEDANDEYQREEKEPRGRSDQKDTRRSRFEDLKGEKPQYDEAPSSDESDRGTDIRKERNGKGGIRAGGDRRDERGRRGDGNARDDGGIRREDNRRGIDEFEDSDSEIDTDSETVRRIREDRRNRREQEPEDRPNDLRHNRREPRDDIDSDDSETEDVSNNNERRERERTRQTSEQIRQAEKQTRKDKDQAKESRKAEADKMAERQAASVNKKKEKERKKQESNDGDNDDDTEMREYNTNRVSFNPKIYFWAGISILKNAPIWSSFSVIGLFLYIEITRQLFSLLSISSGSISASSPTSSTGLSKRASSSVDDLGIDLSITNSWFSNLFKSTGIQSSSLFVLISLWNIICIPLCADLIYSTLEKASNPRQGREKTRSWIIRRIQRVLNSSLRVIIYDKHFSDNSSSGGTKFSQLRSFIKKINRYSIVRFGVFVSQLSGTILVFRQTMSLQYMSGTKSDKTFSTSSDLTWTENSLFEFSENLTEAQVFSITNFVFMILLINLSISWYTYLHPNGKKSSDENGSRSILKWISISLIVSAFVVCLLYFQEIANYLVKSQNTTSASKGATESNGMIVLVGANIMFVTLLPAMGYVVYELNKVWDRKFPEGVFNRKKKKKNESSSNE